MELDTQAKDLSLKKLTLTIDSVNEAIKKAGFLNARILKPREAENAKSLILSSVKEYSKPNLSMEEIVSSVYKINCKKISWFNDDKVKIEYYEN